jgi:Family of unknown function (DUF6022)
LLGALISAENDLLMTTSSTQANPEFDIHDLARRVTADLSHRWQVLHEQSAGRLEVIFCGQPEAARTIGLRRLFSPIDRQLAAEGYELYPRLPGGDPGVPVGARDELQELWIAAVLCASSEAPVGTLVTVTQFDRSGLKLCRAPLVLGLACVGLEAVRCELRRPQDGSPHAGSQSHGHRAHQGDIAVGFIHAFAGDAQPHVFDPAAAEGSRR